MNYSQTTPAGLADTILANMSKETSYKSNGAQEAADIITRHMTRTKK